MIQIPPKIDLLPEHLIDQIKAGEVIERPGNLIKEILENAVDAGSSKIELTLKNNGLDLIAIKDDGHGMHFDDLPLAFSRHATSKISRFEDLYKLRSFGFRGEALASIAAISKIQCITKTKDSLSASELRIEGSQNLFHGIRETSPMEHGTELVIQDLFFNTPARLKFIQSQQSEKTFIRKIIYAFILSRPEIEFQIKIDDAEKDIFPRRKNHLERVQDIFPKANSEILHSERFYENNELNLFLIPGTFRGPFKIQSIFINDRYILDKQLHRVMSNGIDSNYGNDFHYIAYFNLPTDTIDVNVHPNKTIIRCMEMSKMISLLTSTVRELATKKADVSPGPENIGPTFPTSVSPSFLSGLDLNPTLHQERHEYNMEGVFSPHNIPEMDNSQFIWIGSNFIRKDKSFWQAVSSTKLLELYTKTKLKHLSTSIPLLVTEPFPARDIKKETLEKLIASGVELEYLGAETLVLRSIPEWMNGFPLKGIVTCLLQEKSFSELEINPLDWSQSTWLKMLDSAPFDELIKQKVAVDLSALLKERLK